MILVCNIIVNGLLITPIAMFSNIDPIHHVIKNLFPYFNESFFFIRLFCRVVLQSWVTIESARTHSIILPQTLCFNYLFMKCLKRVKNFENKRKALLIYTHLRLVSNTGQNCIRYIAGVYMICGLILLVTGNYSVLKGWKSLPATMYSVMVLILLCIYILVSETVPLITKCHSFSKQMIEVDWFSNMAITDCFVKRKDRKMWRLRVQAQKPITFYYGPALFEKNTKINFYSRVINHSVDALLLL